MTQNRPNAYLMELPPNYRRMAQEIAALRSKPIDGRTRNVQMAEAIRYAVAFTHKQLTDVINPEDLHDDD